MILDEKAEESINKRIDSRVGAGGGLQAVDGVGVGETAEEDCQQTE